jgi:hypothetical protein
MRQAYAHEAVVHLEPDGDVRGPGAAVTVALCGHWDHEPPCPLAPHASESTRDGGRVVLRIVFATEPAHEPEVRQRIDDALSGGRVDGPEGPATWRLESSASSPVRDEERDLAARWSA